MTRIFPVIHDLTRSHEAGNWELHLSGTSRALPLCFALDRVNYKRCLPLYYEDADALKEKFLNMHPQFSMGDFTVKHKKAKRSESKGFIWCHRYNKKEGCSPEMKHIETYESEIH